MKLLFLFLLLSTTAFAGRPLITDDSGVVGDDNLQIESWFFADKRSFQHWIVPTLGIGNSVEVSASGVQGASLLGANKNQYANSGPIMQAKVALPESFALSGGFLPPFGAGEFRTKKWDYFVYLAHSNNLGNLDTLLHINLGLQTRRQSTSTVAILWGIAVERKITQKSYVFLESANGDVYALIPGVAIQSGMRYDLTPNLQVDGTLGRGVTGEPILPLWGTLGIKVVI